MESQDTTEMNKIELTLNAAKKRSATQARNSVRRFMPNRVQSQSGEVALQQKKRAQEDEEKAKREAGETRRCGATVLNTCHAAGKAKLKGMSAKWENAS